MNTEWVFFPFSLDRCSGNLCTDKLGAFLFKKLYKKSQCWLEFTTLLATVTGYKKSSGIKNNLLLLSKKQQSRMWMHFSRRRVLRGLRRDTRKLKMSTFNSSALQPISGGYIECMPPSALSSSINIKEHFIWTYFMTLNAMIIEMSIIRQLHGNLLAPRLISPVSFLERFCVPHCYHSVNLTKNLVTFQTRALNIINCFVKIPINFILNQIC